MNGLKDMQLGNLEKIDLACGQSGILELTRRAGFGPSVGVIGMEKVNKKGQRQKNPQKKQVGNISAAESHYH
jgi:hypothetical protein